MKCAVTIGLIITTLPVFSQKTRMDFSRVDRSVLFIKPASPSLLAYQLTASCTSEIEKVRAIFRWIAENISYRTDRPRAKNLPVVYDPELDTAALKPLNERVAETVLEKGTAVCDGYARLFKTLCDYAGIHSELITGYARTEAYKSNQRFRSNHTWNAVLIDSAWYLLDVTWASGYITWWGDNFIRHFNEEYFLTNPSDFITEHYPDDIRWSLLNDPPAIPEFRYSPYRQRTFIKYKISGYKPAKGTIEANLGDTLQFELETSDIEADKRIGADPFLDTAIYSTPASVLLTPDVINGNRIRYTCSITSPLVKWIYVLYNGDVVLRYNVSVKNN